MQVIRRLNRVFPKPWLRPLTSSKSTGDSFEIANFSDILNMEFSVWLAFFAASWAISISPGAGAVAAMSSGLNHGFLRGYITTIGLILGIWTQVIIVGVGLGTIVAASSVAFGIIKWLGAAYLIWLGISQFRAPRMPIEMSAEMTGNSRLTARRMIFRGWVINAVNPKGTIFLLAVVPHFIDPAQALWPQYFIIGATIGFTDLVVMGGYTALASRVLKALKSPASIGTLNRIFGSMFVLAGTFLATVNRATTDAH
jgi:homoserine/homoserine lactone efflux protein